MGDDRVRELLAAELREYGYSKSTAQAATNPITTPATPTGAAIRAIEKALTLSPSPSGIEDAREALTKAGEAFRKEERRQHEAGDACHRRMGYEAAEPYFSAATRNRDLAEMCESASSKIGGDHG